MWSVADLCDTHGDRVEVLESDLVHYGGMRRFCGQVATVSVKSDNSIVRSVLGNDGAGRVLVISGQGKASSAIVGDQLGELAIRNSWSGVIVDGAIRDTESLAEMKIGIMASRVFPRRGEKDGFGVAAVAIRVGGVLIESGDWIYADPDGVIVSKGGIDLASEAGIA